MADMSMRGPVDLAALAAAKKQENAAPVPGAYLTTLTAAGLNAEVQLSAQVPVIVLFVADGAAGELGTTLEAEARRRDGQIRIAVVNASTEAELVQAFGVRTIPMGIALVGGQPVPLFQGAPTTAQLTELVNQLLAAANRAGVAGRVSGKADEAGEAPVNPHHLAALEALDRGDLDAAEAEFEALAAEDPNSEVAQVGRAQVRLLRSTRGQDPQAVMAAADAGGPGDAAAQIAAADIEVAAGRPDLGFARLINAIKVTSGDAREELRTHLLELFTAVGADTEVVRSARRDLASALF